MRTKAARPRLRAIPGGAPPRWISDARAEQLLLPFRSVDLPPETEERVRRAIAPLRRSRVKWRFAMAALSEDERIGDHLAERCRRPLLAVRVWLSVRANFDPVTQEVTVSRAQLAKRFGVHADEIARVFVELVRINALKAWRDDFGGQHYELSPSIATHLKGLGRDERQLSFGPLRLVEGGGKVRA